ncbi:transcription factor S-II, central domain-containing protein [Lactarius quietus]|nr:transcription factor S-II, central domain-containing protein [Lactarius quietus]
MSSESDDDDGNLSERDGKVRRRGPGAVKSISAGAGTGKRKRTESLSMTTSAADDPARKYCLGKFTEMFSGIFLRYPYVRQKGEGEGEGEVPQEMESVLVGRKAEELSEEEKTQSRERATAFAAEVEQAVFDTYAEADKFGKHGVGAKYKERFRTLTFNLQQSDRVLLHQRISSAQVVAATLATMSSTELASQEQQLSIKQAEQEALAHSILIKSTVPRAKITHKGLQDIEDVNEDSAVAKQRRERELEIAEEERERERLARLRAVQTHSNPPSASVPPDSPAVPSSASAPWNTATPTLTQGQGQGTELASAHTGAVDSELNLGDFIHMDDEPPETSPLTIATPSTTTTAAPAAPSATSTSEPLSATVLTPITGISPFAPSKPDMPPRASFDLNALWSAPPPPPPAPVPSSNEQDGEKKEKEKEKEEVNGDDKEGEPMEMDLGTPPDEPAASASASASVAVASVEPEREVEHEGESGDDDLDFAMFLEEERDGKGKSAMGGRPEASVPDPQAIFDGLPRVWNGVISMPIDSAVPQELRVDARQIGGRGLAADSPLWRTLFPIEHLRIDGRVAVGSSAQYLLASRLNSAKELIAVAWTPVSDADMTVLKTLKTFLINKDRHGLIFPWGARGREWGRELYVVPLPSGHPLPEYIELLDDMRLPRTRSADCLVGIWVLNRGRLTAPPAPAPPPPQPLTISTQAVTSASSAPALPPALASALASIMPSGAAPTVAPTQAAVAAALSHLPIAAMAPQLQPQPGRPLGSLPLPPQPPQQPTSAADLAAQVAALSPEQIQAMLLTLQLQQPAPPPQHQQSLPPPPPPPMHAPAPPQPVPHWPGMQEPSREAYGGFEYEYEHDERERERGRERGGGASGRRGGGYYPPREDVPRGRGRGGRRGGAGASAVAGGAGWEQPRRTSDGGWAGRGRGSASGGPGSPVRRDAQAYWR